MLLKQSKFYSYDIVKHFEKICEIPHGSGNEKKLSDYVLNFARELSLKVIQDKYNNLYIFKPAQNYNKSQKTVALQGHLDMVCEKNLSKQFDFTKDKLQLVLEDDILKADQTTLGADNGVAIAYMMAIMADKSLSHPDLELIMTTDEEVGLCGATNFDASLIKADYLINLDSGHEGEMLFGCAGGIRADIKKSLTFETTSLDNFLEIEIKGLLGGHSGLEIHKERANAIKLAARILYSLYKSFDIRLFDICGGLKDNAIPRECVFKIAVKSKDKTKIIEKIKQIETEIKNEYTETEPNIKIEVKETKWQENVISKNETEQIINILMQVPNGVIKKSTEIKDLVIASNNLGVVSLENGVFKALSAVRSSIESIKEQICNELEIVAGLNNASIESYADYPGWQYDKNSQLSDFCQKVYKNLFNQELLCHAVHAGLECGVFKSKKPSLDIVAFGPDTIDIHTPNESLNLNSFIKTYNFLTEILKNII